MTSGWILKTAASLFSNNNESIQVDKGSVINLTDLITSLTNIPALGAILDTYGQNSEVNYISPFYKNHTSITDNMPTFKMERNDFLLFEFTLSEEWLKQYNLFVFSTYIYSYDGDVIFGTPDNSIFVEPSILHDNKIKICCTSSKQVASKYSKLNYQISKFPYDYMDKSIFNILIRFATDSNNKTSTIEINEYIKTSYNTDNRLDTTDTSKFYNAQEIIEDYPTVYKPISNANTKEVITNYNAITNYLNKNFTTINQAYPYLSNFTDPPVAYAIDDAYRSIKLNPPKNLNGNNTCENYYMTNAISIVKNSNKYLYILYLNQYSSGAGVTSTIQIYSYGTSNSIVNGSIATGPEIPTMDTPNYPIAENNNLPEYGIYGLSMENIYTENVGVSSIVAVERISYGLTNFNYVKYNSINTMVIYIGEKLTDTQVKTLSTDYNINVSYPEDSTSESST
jgi:hypothetical protein